MPFFIKDFQRIQRQAGTFAQPFRSLAHNGEINTLKGNVNWMKVHEQEMSSEVFEDVENLKPVILPEILTRHLWIMYLNY